MKKCGLLILCLLGYYQSISSQLIDSLSYSEFKKEIVPADTSCRRISPVLLSMAVPGLGDYYLRDKNRSSSFSQKAYPWLIMTSAYGFVGSGILLKIQSKKNYRLYHEAIDQSVMNEKYARANSQYKNSYLLIGAGAAIWLTDIICVAIKSAHRKKTSSFESSSFYLNFDGKNQAMTFSLKIRI